MTSTGTGADPAATPLATAVTLLFVPGDRPDRFGKAAGSGADVVVCDLEDAVASAQKPAARTAVADWLAAEGGAAVRVNAPGTPAHGDDLAALGGLPGLRGVVVPMAEFVPALEAVAQALPGVPLLPLVETARGVRAAEELAGVGGVVRLGLGHLDLAADLGADPDDPLIAHCRHEVVLAARCSATGAPVDGVTPTVDHLARVEADARRARSGGFGGKLCIHPAQLAPVARAFTPSEGELRWATAVLGADAGGVAVVDGTMVDAPVVARAQALLARAEGGSDG